MHQAIAGYYLAAKEGVAFFQESRNAPTRFAHEQYARGHVVRIEVELEKALKAAGGYVGQVGGGGATRRTPWERWIKALSSCRYSLSWVKLV